MQKLAKLQTGFTLLEAMVAIVLISVVGMALYSWVNVSTISITRAIDVKEQSDVIESAVAFISQLNPEKYPEGAELVGEYTVRWTSELQGSKQNNRRGGGPGFFEVGLYNVSIFVERKGRLVGQYTTRLVGYEKVRDYAAIN